MLTRFETKSSRVRGLCFHPNRPWILASLHSGGIEIWDYCMGTLIGRFDEHEGAVWGVHFHKSQPLFVSGGDDHKIKVWNYNTRKCLFTLPGHLNNIRTVQFHLMCPWIVSASDDQTIRIWDWNSQTCISVLKGHCDSVTSASFHPIADLVVSASLDQTVRVWDITGGPDNATVKYVIEGHGRGVNWASFHPFSPLVVSGAEDGQVKLWRMDVTKMYELATFKGHANNVTSVLFHPKQDIIVSNSEDKSIRIWDATERTEHQTFHGECGRYWSLAVHPKSNLLAAGHDSGLIVFKLERKRPAFALSGDSLFYTKGKFLWYYEFSTKKDVQVIPICRPRTLSYSPTDKAVLICSDHDGGSYELYIIPEDSIGTSDVLPEAKRGIGGSAVFISPDRFAVLDKSTNQVSVKNLNKEEIDRQYLPILTDAIFYAGTGNLLCRSEDKVVIFNLQQKLILGYLQTPFVRYVVWSKYMEKVALLCKHTIIIASKKLDLQYTLHEKICVKSGAWNDDGVFIYTTLTEMKYCLPIGVSKIITTLDVPVYITKVSENEVFCLDRNGENTITTIDLKQVEDKKRKRGELPEKSEICPLEDDDEFVVQEAKPLFDFGIFSHQTKICIYHLSMDVKKSDLKKFFKKKAVDFSYITLRSQSFKQEAIVTFKNHEDLKKALILHGEKMGEEKILLSEVKGSISPYQISGIPRYPIVSKQKLKEGFKKWFQPFGKVLKVYLPKHDEEYFENFAFVCLEEKRDPLVLNESNEISSLLEDSSSMPKPKIEIIDPTAELEKMFDTCSP